MQHPQQPPPVTADELEFAEAWKPKPGEVLIGTVSSVDSRESEYGSYPIIVVSTEGGDRAFHAFHTVAKNELAKLRPQPGDSVGIKYHGRDEDAGYERYVVKVKKAGRPAGVDWDAVGAEADEELGAPTDEDDEYLTRVLADAEDGDEGAA